MWRFCALGAVVGLGLVACSHTEPTKTTPTFESSLPPMASRFSGLDDQPDGRDACADLTAAATFTFAETPEGAAIVLVPRGGHSAADVTKAATEVEARFLPGLRHAQRETCRIFEKGDEVNVHLTTSGGTRLVFETFDPKKTPDVRERVKSFVTAHGR